MKRMKNNIAYIFLLLLGVAGGQASAQDNSYAQRLLDRTVSVLESMADYRADFVYTYPQASPQSGTMYARGDRYRVETDEFTLFSDGQYTYTVMDAEQEVTVRSVSDPEASALGSVQAILRRFADTFTPRTDRREGTVQYLRLMPREQDNPSQYVLVGIDTATGMPVRVEDVARDGSHTVLDIVSIVRGEGAADSLYRFDAKKYEQNGYYIARP